MVSLPPQLFLNTQIPACLWFLTRDKTAHGRDHRGEFLFIDARKMGRMETRVNRVFTPADIAQIVDVVHRWRQDSEAEGAYEDVPGFCRSVKLDEVREHGYVLTPGRYVGAEEVEDDDEAFGEKMDRLTALLSEQIAKGAELDAVIRERLGRSGMECDPKQVQLSDCADMLTGFPFKSAQYTTEGRRLLRGDNIAQGKLRWDGVKFWRADDTASGAYALQAGDVVLAMDRPWIEAGLKCAQIGVGDAGSLLVQRVARLRARSEVDPFYLYGVLRSRAFTEYVLGVQTGTAVPHISKAQIGTYSFVLPCRDHQRATGKLLQAIEARIQALKDQSACLEAIARAIFKSWFVDFDPVRAKAEGREPERMDAATAALFPSDLTATDIDEAPTQWPAAPIGYLAEIVGGSTPSTGNSEYWNSGRYCWATPKDLSKLQSPILLGTERCITDAGLRTISSGLLPVGTVLLSSRAPIGYLAIAAVPTAINQGSFANVASRWFEHWRSGKNPRHVDSSRPRPEANILPFSAKRRSARCLPRDQVSDLASPKRRDQRSLRR